MIELPIILTFSIGFFIGKYFDSLEKRIKELEKPKPETGATVASYGRINEYNSNQGGETGLVMPKTPNQLEWEEQERLREAQLRVKVK